MNKFTLSAIAIALAGCSNPEDYHTSSQFADAIKLQYQVTSNHPDSTVNCGSLGAEWATCNQFNLLLENNDNGVISSGWTIYLHSVRRLLDVQSDQIAVSHITGDLYKLEPTEHFQALQPGDTLVIPIIGEFFEVSKSDFIPGAFVVDSYNNAQTLKWSDTEDLDKLVLNIKDADLKRTLDDESIISSASTRFQDNLSISRSYRAGAVFPTPSQVDLSSERVDISTGFNIEHLEQNPRTTDLIFDRIAQLNLKTKGTFPLVAVVSETHFDEEDKIHGAYQLSISHEGIGIVGFDEAGVFYGLSTMLGLIDDQSLPIGTIEDAPRFDYRGVMIDIARNFHTKGYLLDLIEEMSLVKMNKLALHMSDDEGWRLEIPGLSELTDVGSKRCFDLEEQRCLLPQLGSSASTDNFGSGHLSREDFIEILIAASARHIEIIPEFDMPAHARAAVVSMEARYQRLINEGRPEAANEYRLIDPLDTSNVTTVQYYDRTSFINPCLSSSIAFTQKVMFEVSNMYSDANVPIRTWHFGGDEAKNIKLGAGFQDISTPDPVDFKGTIDLSEEHYPFEMSPACQALVESGEVESYEALPSYWAQQTSKLAANIGYDSFQAWEDGLKFIETPDELFTNNVRVNFWETLSADGDENAYKWANRGYDIVISVPDYLYFDFPQAIDQRERGFYWATRENPLKKVFAFSPENLPSNASYSVNRDGKGFEASSNEPNAQFAGMSVQLWSEVVRNDEQAEYMVYPRLYAAAERAWHRGDWELEYQQGKQFTTDDNAVDLTKIDQAWNQFVTTLGETIMPRLDEKAIQYRLPLAGAIIDDGKLFMNASVPALTLEYSLDKGKNWNIYHSPIAIDTPVGDIRVRTASAVRSGRATSL